MDGERIATAGEKERIARFLQELKARGRSPRTRRAYELDWSQFATWYAAANQEPFTLKRLAAMDVQDYITWGRQEGLKASTLNRRLAWLKQYAAWGQAQDLLTRDIRRRIRAIPIQSKQQLAPRSLIPAEARKRHCQVNRQ